MSGTTTPPRPAGEAERTPVLDTVALRRAFEEYPGSQLVLTSKVYLDDDVLHRLSDTLSQVAGREIEIVLKVNPTMDAGAILYVGSERRIVLDPRSKWLADVNRSVSSARETGGIESPAETYEFLRDMLRRSAPEVCVEELLDTGSVLEVGDGVALVSGMRDVGSQELVEFAGGVFGLAFSLLEDRVGCILLGPEQGIREGSDVTRTGHLLRIAAGDSLQGRIVNSLGQAIDAKGPVAPKAYLPVERKAPGVVERRPVDTPLHTGIKIIDALVPLGRGQRELIIGDRKIGKTTIAVDTILAQKGTGVACVYASIGQKASSLARVVDTLEKYGAMEYTTIVAALPSEQPAFRYLAPYAACAIGEWWMEQGKDALVIYDDLTKHAVTYREMSALLGRPIGREAYPGDIFYVHSRLLERAARLSDARGGGSLTALPIVETMSSDISAFIPTNVISICDGQIMLESQLFNEGIRPAMEVGLSVSRVGGSAQTRSMKQVAGRLRIDLAQYQEMAQFVKFGAEVDQATLEQLARGERCRELLKQPQHVPMNPEHEVLVLFGSVSGMFDGVPVEELAGLEGELLQFVDVHHPALVESLRTCAEITPAMESDMRCAVADFVSRRGGSAQAGPAEEPGAVSAAPAEEPEPEDGPTGPAEEPGPANVPAGTAE